MGHDTGGDVSEGILNLLLACAYLPSKDGSRVKAFVEKRVLGRRLYQ